MRECNFGQMRLSICFVHRRRRTSSGCATVLDSSRKLPARSIACVPPIRSWKYAPLIPNRLGIFPDACRSIVLESHGVLTANQINGGINAASSSGGFTLQIEPRSILRLGESVSSPVSLSASDQNFTLINDGKIKTHYSETLTSSQSIISQVNAFNREVVA